MEQCEGELAKRRGLALVGPSYIFRKSKLHRHQLYQFAEMLKSVITIATLLEVPSQWIWWILRSLGGYGPLGPPASYRVSEVTLKMEKKLALDVCGENEINRHSVRNAPDLIGAQV
jgi:hypothetical protein